MSPSGTDRDALHDLHLRRALDHAPDQAVTPDWRLRKAILKRAHDAVGALDPVEAEAELERAGRTWWRGIGARGGRKSRIPWVAAFAIVLVAALAIVLWGRQPVPLPHPDEAARVTVPAPTPKDEASDAPAPEVEAAASSAPPAVAEMPEPELLPAPEPAPADEPAPAPPAVSVAPPPPAEKPGTPPQAATPPQPQAADPLPPVARVAAPAPAAANSPRSPSVRTDETDPPTFEALSQWSRITISRRGGETRSFPRAEARDLNALLGSAALSAVGPRPLKGTPEWRVTLERNGEVLATFELASPQVRWREGKTPPATGVPSGPALSALRDALSLAVQQPEAAPSPPEPPRTP